MMRWWNTGDIDDPDPPTRRRTDEDDNK